PPPPLYRWTKATAEQLAFSKVWQQCDWLQTLEGGIDNVHSNCLHGGRPPGLKYAENTARGRGTNFSKPIQVEVVPTDYGYSYGSLRDKGDGESNYVRG